MGRPVNEKLARPKTSERRSPHCIRTEDATHVRVTNSFVC